MTRQDLIKEIEETIQQFILINNKKGGYQQISIFIEDKQFFADQMSQYAIIDNKSYVLFSASDVSTDQKECIIAQAINTYDPKAIYRLSETKVFAIENNRETELSDLSIIENLFNKIRETLIAQLIKQTDSIGQKIKVGAQNKLEENEKINKFLTTFVNQQEVIFKLTGDNLVKSLTGTSVNSLIEQYVEKAKSFLQPNELMSLASPSISVNFGPELFSIYENMSPKSQNVIHYLISVDDSIYLNLFSILKHKAIFGSKESQAEIEPTINSDEIQGITPIATQPAKSIESAEEEFGNVPASIEDQLPTEPITENKFIQIEKPSTVENFPPRPSEPVLQQNQEQSLEDMIAKTRQSLDEYKQSKNDDLSINLPTVTVSSSNDQNQPIKPTYTGDQM